MRQFSRLFPPVIFLLVILANLLIGKSAFEKNRDLVLDEPTNKTARLSLAYNLLSQNQLTAAQKEFILAKDATGLESLAKVVGQPEDIKTKITLWEKITDQFPNYRDGYLELALLNYKIGRLPDARKFLDKAMAIDPNNEVTQRLSSLL